jgi:TolB protein
MEDRKMKLQSGSMLLAVTIVLAMNLFGQDRFKVTRLTSDPMQEGFPTWSPDGGSFLFSRFSWDDTLGKNGIWKFSFSDKKVTQVFSGIAEHPNLSPDGRLIVFDADTGSSMRMIDAKGGSPTAFLPDSIGIHNGGLPCWSPAGTQIAFKEAAASAISVYHVKTGGVTRIFQEQRLLALPGCWSRDGESVLIALMDRQSRRSTMWRISADGREKQQITGHHEGFYRYLALSPDGSLLAYAAMEGRDLGLWVMPAQGGKSLPLAVTHPGHNESPAWSPDGKRLAFTSTRSGNFDIWVMDLDVVQLRKELDALNK